MKAARIHAFGGPEVIKIEEVETPAPGDGEVLVRIEGSSVNPVDYKIRKGDFLPADKLPLTLGRDFSGVVAKAPASGPWREGDEVFAMAPMELGANAEWIAVKGDVLAKRPETLDQITTASLGLASLTAWQGLFDHGGLKEGQRVLIHGAAGGVGHLAVQFARAKGAVVFATCGPDDLDYVRGLGAEAIDYKSERFEERAQDLDLVFDLIGGETQARSFSVLKPGGALISSVAEPDKAKAEARGVRTNRYMAQPSGAQLEEVRALIEAGEVEPVVHEVFALEDLAGAHRALEKGHLRGKIVLRVA